MIDDRPAIGAALDREIARAEAVDAEIERFIERRGTNPPNGEQEARWGDSEKKAEAEQEKRLRGEWCLYHLQRAQALRETMETLIANHEEQARKYSKNGDAA